MKKLILIKLFLFAAIFSSCTVYQNSALEEAISNNDYNGVKTALAKGADPNAATQNQRGHSMTSYAAYKGNSRISGLLTSYGGKSQSSAYGKKLKQKQEIAEAERRAAAEKYRRERAEEKAAEDRRRSAYCKWCNAPNPPIKSTGWLGSGYYYCSQKCKADEDISNRLRY